MKRLPEFEKIVGQNIPVTRLQESVMSAENGKEMLSPLFIGEAGKGKTALMHATMNALENRGFNRLFFSSPEEFRSGGEAYDSLVQLLTCGEPFVLGIDEAHLFKKRATVRMDKIFAFIMKALDKTNQNGRPIKIDDNLQIPFDRKAGSIILATNFPDELDPSGAFQSRCDQIILDDYSEDELVEILQVMLEKIQFKHANPETLRLVARCGRGTARPMEKILDQIRITRNASGENRNTINKDDVFQALILSKMYPRGLSSWEIKLMQHCDTPQRLNVLRQMITNVDKKSFDKGTSYMISQGFMGLSSLGLQKTARGVEYLKQAKSLGFNVEI